MWINPLFFPTLLIAAMLFWVGVYAETNIKGTRARTLFHFIAAIASVPALAYVVYYFHLFDHAAWFFELRAHCHSPKCWRQGSGWQQEWCTCGSARKAWARSRWCRLLRW